MAFAKYHEDNIKLIERRHSEIIGKINDLKDASKNLRLITDSEAQIRKLETLSTSIKRAEIGINSFVEDILNFLTDSEVKSAAEKEDYIRFLEEENKKLSEKNESLII